MLFFMSWVSRYDFKITGGNYVSLFYFFNAVMLVLNAFCHDTFWILVDKTGFKSAGKKLVRIINEQEEILLNSVALYEVNNGNIGIVCSVSMEE